MEFGTIAKIETRFWKRKVYEKLQALLLLLKNSPVI